MSHWLFGVALTSSALILGASLAFSDAPVQAAEAVVAAPAATSKAKEGAGKKVAIFAGGCFWGVEAVFSHTKGVSSAVSGYHGDGKANATYDKVSAGQTRHAEAVRVTYDPAVIRYDELLRIYFSVIIDPTLKDRQGPDRGTQYRTAIVPLSAEQSRVAKAYIAQLTAAKTWPRPIVTRIEKYAAFYPAEGYHQDFMLENPRHAYIVRWDAPKVAALKRLYPGYYSAKFVRN